MLATGVVSEAAGTMIAVGWPGTIWIIGFILGFDILCQGIALLATAFALRAMHRSGMKGAIR